MEKRQTKLTKKTWIKAEKLLKKNKKINIQKMSFQPSTQNFGRLEMVPFEISSALGWLEASVGQPSPLPLKHTCWRSVDKKLACETSPRMPARHHQSL